MKKAICLFSGGLDSRLALRVIAAQGIEVIALHFVVPFTRKNEETAYKMFLESITNDMKTELKVVYLKEDYLEMLKNPEHGYGKNLNPCIDCKIFMLKIAKEVMLAHSADFIVSGEVIGQRPMSQKRNTLKLIEKQAGVEGLLLRPLSAKLMHETIPEQSGWIDREKLLAINGRGRREQLDWAAKFELKDFPWPGGGCLLTDANFCNRLKDLMLKNMFVESNIGIIKFGRYFKISENAFLILGRDEDENNELIKYIIKNDTVLSPVTLPGPLAVIRGKYDSNIIKLSASILARYTKNSGSDLIIKISCNDMVEACKVDPLPDEEIKKYLP